MSLNLISDAWIPVLDREGCRRVIAPWQMADAKLLRPDWPRPDLNVACLELLIGLVLLADPPAEDEEWEERRAPDPERLRERLARFSPAFSLLGDGSRFMQELGGLEGVPIPPDLLFMDSGGKNGALTVRSGRYRSLDLPLASIALYTLQTQAPEGGRGHLTSLRAGGPMVTLVDPGHGLWPLVWANVPAGQPAEPEILPWMRRTVTSDTGLPCYQHMAHPAEVMFGMPRRLWLVDADASVVGVIQRPSGTRYASWRHPMTPYQRSSPDEPPRPVRPRPGQFGYRNWLGIVAAMPRDGLSERAAVVETWNERAPGIRANVIVAGWAMKSMKARDFILSRAPLIELPEEKAILLAGMVQAAELYGVALRAALRPVLAEGEAREAAREEFFIRTQEAFEARLQALSDPDHGDEDESRLATARDWLGDMCAAAMTIFEEHSIPGLPDRRPEQQKAIVDAHRGLRSAFAGFGKSGGDAWAKLEIPPPETKKRRAA